MTNQAHKQNPVNLLSCDMLTILIREELKSRKLAAILHGLGVEEQCPWLPSLNDPIADCIGIHTDAEFHEYDMLMGLFVNHTCTVNDATKIASDLVNRLKSKR